MRYVHDVLALAGGAVLGDEVGDGAAGAVDLGGFEVAVGVLVLGVDDQEGAVCGASGGAGDADKVAEGGSL